MSHSRLSRYLSIGKVLFGVAICCVGASDAIAQPTAEVRVTDERGVPIPFAYVFIRGITATIADDSGRVPIRIGREASAEVTVRRIGYSPLDTVVQLRPSGTMALILRTLPATLGAVVTTAQQADPLVQRGFYDRMLRARSGAFVADFIGPEELRLRNPMSASRALLSSRYARIARFDPTRVVITGRGGCAMSVLIDGTPLTMSTQQVHRGDPTSIDPRGTSQRAGRLGEDPQRVPDIDALITGSDIAAIEVYPSAANAPAELQRANVRGSCGIVAIWTGSRGTP